MASYLDIPPICFIMESTSAVAIPAVTLLATVVHRVRRRHGTGTRCLLFGRAIGGRHLLSERAASHNWNLPFREVGQKT